MIVKHKQSFRIKLSKHFVYRWCEYFGEERETRIKATLKKLMQEQPIYGRTDGSFEIKIRNTKAIMKLDPILGWQTITLLHPHCAEMVLERAGLTDLARRHGAKLNCKRYDYYSL